MRSIPSSLTNQYATELDVKLELGGSTFSNLLTVPELETTLSIDNVTAQNIQVEVDDTDDRIKTMADSTDMHKLSAKITVNTMVVFDGQVVTPVEWDRDRRTAKLTLTSKVETEEYGFSPERGEVEHLSDDAIGKPWPLVFGSPRYVPAVKVKHQAQGVIEDKFCKVDPTLYENRSRLINTYNQAFYMFTYYQNMRQELLNKVKSLPLYQGSVGGYIDQYLNIIKSEDALQQTVLAVVIELNHWRQVNKQNNDRASAQAIQNLETVLKALAIQSNELALKKEFFEGTSRRSNNFGYDTPSIIEQLDFIWAQDKQFIRDQQQWLNAMHKAHADYLANEEIICQQELCVKSSVRVKHTDVPEGENIEVTIKGSKYVVNINDDEMTLISGPKALYTNITPDTWAEDDTPCVEVASGMDLIRLTGDEDLRGKFLLVKKRGGFDNVRHILKVREQIGKKVYFELVQWNRDNSGGPRGQSVNDLINDVLSPNTPSASVGGTGYPDWGSKYGGFAITETFNNYGNPAFDFFGNTTSYRAQIQDILDANPFLTLEEITNIIKLVAYQRLDNTANISFQEPTVRDIYTIVAPDIEVIEAVAGTVLESWLNEYYIPYEEYREGSRFLEVPVGTTFYYGDNCDVYVANLIESTVHAVHAFRKNDQGETKLEAVPEDYYNVDVRDLTTYDTTTIVFPTPLEDLGEGWEDEIFVTQTSTVGRNVVDVIEWLLNTYSNLTLLNKSDIETKVENYPVDFALFDVGDVLEKVKRIFYEARLSAIFSGTTYKLIYLPERQANATSIDESDYLDKSYKKIDGNDVITKIKGTWNGGDYLPKEDKDYVVLRNNIPRYGLIEIEEEYHIYSIKELVEKSVQFNLLRKSYSWRREALTVTPHLWLLEPLDIVRFNGRFNQVETGTLDLNSGLMKLVIHTATVAGENEQFEFYWPKDMDAIPWGRNDPAVIEGSIK